MALTLGTTGMDSATEAELRAAFQQANAGLGNRWQLVGEADAEFVVVDMDSMYGPMSWLRLHAAGKQVIGLTSAPRTQTDYRLERPIDAAGVSAVLTTISGGGLAVQPTTPASAPMPSGMSPSPVPQDQLPEEMPQKPREDLRPPAPAPKLPDSVQAGTLGPTTIEPPAPHAAPAPVAAAPSPVAAPAPAAPRERHFADWLAAGALDGRVRYQKGAGPAILIDGRERQYHGPAALKPLAGYFDGPVERAAFGAIDDATWAREAGTLGAAQPLQRLEWYGGLLAGKGKLPAGVEADAKFKLGKWPQTEREFPKHFRVATAMMKGPATIDDLVAASGVPHEDVVDFVNANLATGFAEVVSDAPTEPTDSQKGGLFGRLRGK